MACSVCTHPDHDAIDASLARDLPNRRIATQYGLSEAAVRRHKASHLRAPTPTPKLPKIRQKATQHTDTPTPVRARASGPHRQGYRLTDAERDEAKATVLRVLAEQGTVRAACAAAGVHRSMLDVWAEHDETFAIELRYAKLDADDRYREEIRRRGVDGVPEPVVSQGRIVLTPDGTPLTVQKYSDALLMFQAKARMPEYREKVDITTTTNPFAGVADAIVTALHDPDTTTALTLVLERMAHAGRDPGGSGTPGE